MCGGDAAHWARVLALGPLADAVLAKDVAADEHDRPLEGVLADGALAVVAREVLLRRAPADSHTARGGSELNEGLQREQDLGRLVRAVDRRKEDDEQRLRKLAA